MEVTRCLLQRGTCFEDQSIRESTEKLAHRYKERHKNKRLDNRKTRFSTRRMHYQKYVVWSMLRIGGKVTVRKKLTEMEEEQGRCLKKMDIKGLFQCRNTSFFP